MPTRPSPARLRRWYALVLMGAQGPPSSMERRERFRYLGPAGRPLDLDTVVEWKGKEYRVGSAHLMGEDICPHWRAVLYPREEAPE